MLISERISVNSLKCVKYRRFRAGVAVGGSSLHCSAPLFVSQFSPILPPSVRYRGVCVSVYILYTIFDVHDLHTSVGNIVRYSANSRKRKSTENQLISVLCGVLPFCFVTPVGFTRNGVKYIVYQHFRFLENHGCSLFAHPDISMFFVYLQRKSSYNSLISGCFQC